jgi:hypothetical protein
MKLSRVAVLSALALLSLASTVIAGQTTPAPACQASPAAVSSGPKTAFALSCGAIKNACIAGCDYAPFPSECDQQCWCDYYDCKGVPLPPYCS